MIIDKVKSLADDLYFGKDREPRNYTVELPKEDLEQFRKEYKDQWIRSGLAMIKNEGTIAPSFKFDKIVHPYDGTIVLKEGLELKVYKN